MSLGEDEKLTKEEVSILLKGWLATLRECGHTPESACRVVNDAAERAGLSLRVRVDMAPEPTS